MERLHFFLNLVRSALLALLVLADGVAPALAKPVDERAFEYAVKATFLYKFGHFVEWPDQAFDSPESPINLCVVGQNPFGDLLDRTVSGQRIGDRPIAVHRMAAIEDSGGCHIIYSAGSKAQPVAAILDAVRGSYALTVTDAAQSKSARGIVHFVVEENRVRFAIDDQAASENGITISSKLLNLAVFVKPRGM